MLKCNKQQGQYDFFSPAMVMANYRKMELLYQKNINCDDLDDRFFLHERQTSHTPSKFTPFQRQGNANRPPMAAQKFMGTENQNPNKPTHY